MQKRLSLLCLLFLLFMLPSALAVDFTDALGREVHVETPQRAVSLYGSYADAWLTSGGALAGATQDVMEDALPNMTPGAQNIGSHHTPNTELLLALEPDFVLLSADLSTHLDVGAILDDAGVPCAFFSTKNYRDYMDMIRLFTQITGREDLCAAQDAQVRAPIEAIIAEAQTDADYGKRTALLLRAYSTGVKVKGSADTVAGAILKDMGFVNIADGDESLMENLSLEAVLVYDPDYIFVTSMGESADAAADAMAALLTDNPAWAGLSAVQSGRYAVLDPDLFHRHPNARWAESYACIRDLLAGKGGTAQ